MPRFQSPFSLLRAVTAPLPRQAYQHSLRFSVATRLRIDSSSNPPPPTSKPSETPSASPEAPFPSRAADLAAAEASTDADSAQAPAPKPILPSKREQKPQRTPKPAAADAEASPTSGTTPIPKPSRKPAKTIPKFELPPAKYHVARSSSKNLPIYTDYKRGGNLHLTTIRKITGDLSALRDELRVFLNKKNEEVKINSLTSHVVVKGHHVAEVSEFLKARGM